MFLPRPASRIPHSVNPDMQQWMRSVQQHMSSGASAGMGIYGVGGFFPSTQPDPPTDILAIIQGQGGSGSGAGSGGEGVPATDQANAYEWVEGIWKVVSDDFVVEELVNGRFGTLNRYPAVEMNGVADVPEGAVVRLKQVGAGVDTFYEFSWSGEAGGSGSGDSMTITCADGSVHPVTISGTSITVGDAI